MLNKHLVEWSFGRHVEIKPLKDSEPDKTASTGVHVCVCVCALYTCFHARHSLPPPENLSQMPLGFSDHLCQHLRNGCPGPTPVSDAWHVAGSVPARTSAS